MASDSLPFIILEGGETLLKKKLFLLIAPYGGLLCFILFLVIGASTLSSQKNQVDCSSEEVHVIATDKDMIKNAKQINHYLKREFPEITPQGVAGMLGNFQQESQMSPKSVQSSAPLSGHGLAQWTGERCTALMNFAKQKGKSWDDLGLQIEYLISELKGAEQAGVSALKITNVEQATVEWQVKFERAGDPMMGNRLQYANYWYSVIGTNDPISSTIIGNGGEESNVSVKCSSTISDNSDIIKIAKGWLGWFHYDQIHPAPDLGSDLKKPNKEGHTDCSGFVWLVLNKCGYKVPGNMQWFTGAMANDARGDHQWFQVVNESETEAGDVIIVNKGSGAGSNGHTGILVEKWKGQETKVIQEGGNGDSVNIEAFSTSFTSLINGGDICFARPIKNK